MGCDYIETIYASLQRTERDRLQGESITTAYLTDTVLSIVHSIYGKDGEKYKYKSQPQVFLPGYTPPKDTESESAQISDATIEVFIAEYRADRIPQFAAMHLITQIAEWSQRIER